MCYNLNKDVRKVSGLKPLTFVLDYFKGDEKMANAAERVYSLIKETVENEGVSLWDVRFLKEGASWYLRVFIDSENGISIDNCTDVSHAIDPIIDEADPIENAYYLQISSPGVERDITLPWHIEALAGERVEARLFAPLDGSRVIVGVLGGLEDGKVLINKDGADVAVPYEAISKMKLLFDFSNI